MCPVFGEWSPDPRAAATRSHQTDRPRVERDRGVCGQEQDALDLGLSNDVLKVQQGSLYPALHKLEQRGWVTSDWQNTENNRRAKIYALAPAGRLYLRQETANWERLSEAITRVVRLTEA